MKEQLPNKITRRAFLGTSAKLALGVSGLLLGTSSLFYYGAVQARKRDRLKVDQQKIPGNFVKIGDLIALSTIQGVEKVPYTATIQDAWVTKTVQEFLYVTNSQDGQLLILSPSCTHLGCTIERTTEAQRSKKKDLFFLCPCHGAEFNKVGDAIGVVTQGLDTYTPLHSAGSVYIDISSPIKRTI